MFYLTREQDWSFSENFNYDNDKTLNDYPYNKQSNKQMSYEL